MQQSSPQPLRTPLYTAHLALEAKLVPFAGWEMPLCYPSGIVAEHQLVRQAAGLFDVSHMGRIRIQGPQTAAFLDWIGTNAITAKEDGAAIYTVMCRADGTAVDDVIVLRQSARVCSVIANAANRTKVLLHLQHYAKGWDVEIIAPVPLEGIIALQGPHSLKLAALVLPISQQLRAMRCLEKHNILIARTGYTGEVGFEFLGPGELIVALWQQLLTVGATLGVKAVGLGARDTLRLEMGYALYGHELSDTISPNESVAAWTIKWNKGPFLGSEAMATLAKSGQQRWQCGLWLEEGIARAGCTVWQQNVQIGTVTSGSFSPSLKNGIALAMVGTQLPLDTAVTVAIRGKHYLAHVVALPFYHPQHSTTGSHA